ncbi:HNH endonuclease [Rhizobium sp. RAF56]|uniref:HNH endonuclease n=1 Tax=Rhizobium sp. RAF56 TaxID=3233062 RepID=UPI003F97CA95
MRKPEAIGQITAEHRIALDWFRKNAGRAVSWAEMQAYADTGARLVNQAKGIYKPAYTDYALSVRQTLNGPYADRPVTPMENGAWEYRYFQEGALPKDRDQAATNRGLVRCMEDGVPVGVLLQRKPKPGVTYDVLGLATVVEWSDGYFILRSVAHGEEGRRAEETKASLVRTAVEAAQPEFVPDTPDTRERTMAEVVRRRGQGAFRQKLILAYDRKCAITDCDAVEALDAAHITPYLGVETNDPRNGLLLRADLHNLFDLGLLAVDVVTMSVVVAESLRSTVYGDLHGKALRSPSDTRLGPSRGALLAHRNWAEI